MATTTMTHPTHHVTTTAAKTRSRRTTTRTTTVIGGVDTHRDTHTTAALDTTGRLLGTATFPATATGYQQLLDWLRGFGPVDRIGIEGTSAYGTGLTRHLTDQQIPVLEVDRPDRRARRTRGKSDPIDAEAAARAALAGERVSTPKHHHGPTEALRALRIVRRSAVAARAIVLQQIHALLVTAPEPLRGQLRGLGMTTLITLCAGEDPGVLADPASITDPSITDPSITDPSITDPSITDPIVATRLALRHLACRHRHLSGEITILDRVITALIDRINPALLGLAGVGPDCAGQLLVTAGDNPARLRSEASFAHLCGASPIPASSGRTDRHRLNRGGDRQANAALYRIVLSRLRWDDRIRGYVERRTRQGLSKKDIIRCLKRYVAREVYTVLTSTNPTPTTP